MTDGHMVSMMPHVLNRNAQEATMKENIKLQLSEFRDTIDNIDAALVHLLAERFKITQKVGHFKAEHTLPPADKEREKEQVARLRRIAEISSLDPDFAEKFLNFIISEVIQNHEKIKGRQ